MYLQLVRAPQNASPAGAPRRQLGPDLIPLSRGERTVPKGKVTMVGRAEFVDVRLDSDDVRCAGRISRSHAR